MSLHRQVNGPSSGTGIEPGAMRSAERRRHAFERRMAAFSQAGEGLWDAAAAARYLSVSRSLVYKLEQAGELPCVRIGACIRFEPAVVRAFARGEVSGQVTGPRICGARRSR
jgi:excisionase family DNA binding protein